MEMGGMGGCMHACNAAHHRGDSLGPMHSERMEDNEWAHERLHSERVNYRAGWWTKEKEIGVMGECRHAMQ